MWRPEFQQRLAAWHDLRHQVYALPPESSLLAINQWWFASPWHGYYLHWDDSATWPDPWQLLHDNVFCEVARALGIVYTVILLERDDLQDLALWETAQGTIVIDAQGKYILNWLPDTIVNISPKPGPARRVLTQQQIQKKLK